MALLPWLPSSTSYITLISSHPNQPSLSKKHAVHGRISINLDFVHIPVHPIRLLVSWFVEAGSLVTDLELAT